MTKGLLCQAKKRNSELWGPGCEVRVPGCAVWVAGCDNLTAQGARRWNNGEYKVWRSKVLGSEVQRSGCELRATDEKGIEHGA